MNIPPVEAGAKAEAVPTKDATRASFILVTNNKLYNLHKVGKTVEMGMRKGTLRGKATLKSRLKDRVAGAPGNGRLRVRLLTYPKHISYAKRHSSHSFLGLVVVVLFFIYVRKFIRTLRNVSASFN